MRATRVNPVVGETQTRIYHQPNTIGVNDDRRGRTAYRGENGVTLSRSIVLLLALWLVVVIIGFNLNGLFWLGIIGLVLFVGTGMFAAISIEALLS